MGMETLYPSYLMVFVVFNLLTWWYKGEPYINWWWFLPLAIGQFAFYCVLMKITENLNKFRKGEKK